MEIVWTGLGSLLGGDLRLTGNSNIWMFFIYGCAVLLEPVHDAIASWKWPIRGLLWTVLIWGMEYGSGLLLYVILGVHPWIYTGPLAIDGLITLAYAPAWFGAGLLFERVHRMLDRYGIA